jgi:Zn-dependent peptidase ImmA (M78 family)
MSVHPYRKEALEAIARKIITGYDSRLLNVPSAIPIEAIIEQVYGLTIEYQYIRNNGRVLGETVFEDAIVAIYDRENSGGYKLMPVKAGTVIIDASLLSNRADGRLRFTCAHELAHWVLHKEFYSSLGETAAMTKGVRSSEADNQIERQADRLGCYLLMPKGTVKKAFFSAVGNIESRIISLADLFGVSRQAMKIRLDEMGLLM